MLIIVRYVLFQKLNMTLSVELLLSFEIYATENVLGHTLSLYLSFHDHEPKDKLNGELPLPFSVTKNIFR